MEDRQQRKIGNTEFHDIHSIATVNIYISSKGRVFRRLDFAYPSEADKLFRSEQIIGEKLTGSSRPSSAQFKDRAMQLDFPFASKGQRFVNIVFNDDFSNCSASVSYLKDFGAQYIIKYNSRRQIYQEIYSINSSNVLCSVRIGADFSQ